MHSWAFSHFLGSLDELFPSRETQFVIFSIFVKHNLCFSFFEEPHLCVSLVGKHGCASHGSSCSAFPFFEEAQLCFFFLFRKHGCTFVEEAHTAFSPFWEAQLDSPFSGRITSHRSTCYTSSRSTCYTSRKNKQKKNTFSSQNLGKKT